MVSASIFLCFLLGRRLFHAPMSPCMLPEDVQRVIYIQILKKNKVIIYRIVSCIKGFASPMPAAYGSPDARYWQANTRAFFILPVTKVERVMAAKSEMTHELYNAEVRNDTQIPELKGTVLGERFDPR